MSKARLLFGSTFLALAVLLSSGAKAQPAAHVLPKVAKVTVNDPVSYTHLDTAGCEILVS